MGETKLSERKKKILQALVDSYITNVEPISSSQIQNKYLPDVSTATIRSELATLEEMGYLTQPHISSGRVPSTKAYRYYVDNIINNGEIEQLEQLKELISTKYNSVKEIVKDSAKIVSDITNYTSMLTFVSIDGLKIKSVKLLDVFDGNALVLIITDSGVIKNKEIKLPEKVEENYIDVANGLLDRVFAGKSLAEILEDKDKVDEELEEFKAIYEEVLDLLIEYKSTREHQVFVEGKDKIFNYPEYNDVNKVKNFMSIIDHQDKLKEIMTDDDGTIEFSIKIGSEAGKDMEDMALVSAKYQINGKELGQIGVIGPERMDYKKVFAVLKEIGKLINTNK